MNQRHSKRNLTEILNDLSKDPSFYTVLGVNPDSSEDTIRQSYKKRALEWHPDKNPNETDASNLFILLQKAYATLADEKLRQQYDIKLNSNQDQPTHYKDMAMLDIGNQASKLYTNKVTTWIDEYPLIKFVDNLEEVFNSIKETISKNQTKIQQCSICHEFVEDINEHMKDRVNDYLSYLAINANDIDSQLAIISRKGSDWKPVAQLLTTYRKIWESMEWKSFKTIIEKVKSINSILTNTNTNDREFYELLDKPTFDTNQLIITLSNAEFLNKLPDVKDLKVLIDKENHISTTEISKTDNLRMKAGSKYRRIGKLCIIDNESHPILKHLTYKAPQTLLTDSCNEKASKCCSCSKTFGLFSKQIHCRMCGKPMCERCVRFETIRHIGYCFPVTICKSCSVKKIRIFIDTICRQILEQIKLDRFECISEFLAILQAYECKNDDFYECIALQLISKRQFKIALLCSDYINQSENEWHVLAKSMIHEGLYDEALTCFHVISRRFERNSQYWISLGDTNLYTSNESDSFNDSIALALLAYSEAGLNWECFLGKAFKHRNIDVKLFLVRYVKRKFRHTPSEWRTLGESLLTQSSKQPVGVCCLHLTRLTVSEWNIIIQSLICNYEYEGACALLQSLTPTMIDDIRICATPVVRFFCEEINKIVLPTSDRLKPILDSQHIDNILTIAAFIHLKNEDYVWNSLKEEFLSEPKQYEKVMVCHRIQLELNQATSLEWIDQGIIENDSFTFDLKDSLGCDWVELGQYYLKMSHYDTALNCFLRAMTISLEDSTKQVEYIFSLVAELPESIALWYAVVIYRHAQYNIFAVCKSAQYISDTLAVKQEANIQFLISVLHDLVKRHQPMPKPLIDLNLRLLLSLASLQKEFIGGLHFLNGESDQDEQISASLQMKYESHLLTHDSIIIDKAIDKSVVELASALQNIKSADALKQCLTDRIPYLQEHRVKRYFIRATIAKLENRLTDFVQFLQSASVCCWSEEEFSALVILTMNPLLHKIERQSLLLELINFKAGDLSKFTHLVLPVVSSPKQFEFENYLKPTHLVTLLYQYEKGIIKEMKGDSFQCAMAYLDLCMAVSDRTCIVSNWILACVHLLEGLSRMTSCPKDQARSYAYRNLINELTINAFLLAREHLTPHMQIYVYRLVLSLLLHTNHLFTQLIKPNINNDANQKPDMLIGSRHITIIQEILYRMIDFPALVPFTQLNPLLTHDIILVELTGVRFLEKYLETMTQSDNNYRRCFYDYYLLESVWRRWVRSDLFELIRQRSMKSLLSDKKWNIADVERLLNDPLIPRTLDGWLPIERSDLNILGKRQYTKVAGIKLNYKTGKITFLLVSARNPGQVPLFGSDDIDDVFTKGITNAIFSLDQPDNYLLSHPFQCMKYLPKQLSGTKYLTTLLHADCLLKFITTGIEINPRWPFQMRPANMGFMQRLPIHLRDLLKSIDIRDRLFSRGNMHRFWIEAGDPVFERSVDEKSNEIVYYISDIPMYIKQHLLKYNDDGKLVDDKTFDGLPDQSPEAQFANVFTENYQEIGTYFPEFLRLKELAKLGALLTFTRRYYTHLKEDMANDESVQHICKLLCEIRSHIQYPMETDLVVDRHYSNIVRDCGFSTYEIPSVIKAEAIEKLRFQAKECDRKALNIIVEHISELCFSNEIAELRSLVDRWLYWTNNRTVILWSSKTDPATQLVAFIRKCVTKHTQKLMDEITKLNVSLESDAILRFEKDSHLCNWIPSVFKTDKTSLRRVYGGVCLLPNFKSGRVQRPTNTCERPAGQEFDGSSKASHPGNTSNNANSDDTCRPQYMNDITYTKANGSNLRFEKMSGDVNTTNDSTYSTINNNRHLSSIPDVDSSFSDCQMEDCIRANTDDSNTANDNNDDVGRSIKEDDTNKEQRWITVFLTSFINHSSSDEDQQDESNSGDRDTHVFDNAVDCMNFLSSIKDGQVLVVVADEYTDDQLTLKKLQGFLPVSVIYRRTGGPDQRPSYTDKEMKDICPKIQCLFTSDFPLPSSSSSRNIFNVFSPNNTQISTRSLNEESTTFVWYQIMIDLILSFLPTPQAKSEFFSECRHIYQNDHHRLLEIDQLEKRYSAKSVVQYYGNKSWFYQLINEALRYQSISKIYHFRMVIKHIDEQLKAMAIQKNETITLYRGQKIGIDEIEKISHSINGLISFNSFLSTTKDEEVAHMFASTDNNEDVNGQTSVVFEMKTSCEMSRDISTLTAFAEEQECLFLIGTIFKIVAVERVEKQRRNYWCVKLVDASHHDFAELKAIKEQLLQRLVVGKGPFKLTWGRFLCNVGQYDIATDFYENWLNELHDVGDHELLATIHNDLGVLYCHKGDHAKSNEHHSLAFAQAQAAPFPISLSVFYEHQAGTRMKLNEYSKAFDDLRRALGIEKRRRPTNEINIGRIFSNMGIICLHRRQYQMAFRYFREAFQRQRRISSARSDELAMTCNNIGHAYMKLKNYVQAEKFYAEAYKIMRRCLPKGHDKVINFENNWKETCKILEQSKNNAENQTPVETSNLPERRYSDVSISGIEILT